MSENAMTGSLDVLFVGYGRAYHQSAWRACSSRFGVHLSARSWLLQIS